MFPKPKPLNNVGRTAKRIRVPFRGGTLEVWSTTSPGIMAIIAQLSLEDPKLDAFYKAAGTIVKDCDDNVVWPPDAPSKSGDTLSMFGDS